MIGTRLLMKWEECIRGFRKPLINSFKVLSDSPSQVADPLPKEGF